MLYSGTTSDDSLIITTLKPSAVQRVSWNPQEVNQTGTNMMSKMTWLGQGTCMYRWMASMKSWCGNESLRE